MQNARLFPLCLMVLVTSGCASTYHGGYTPSHNSHGSSSNSKVCYARAGGELFRVDGDVVHFQFYGESMVFRDRQGVTRQGVHYTKSNRAEEIFVALSAMDQVFVGAVAFDPHRCLVEYLDQDIRTISADRLNEALIVASLEDEVGWAAYLGGDGPDPYGPDPYDPDPYDPSEGFEDEDDFDPYIDPTPTPYVPAERPPRQPVHQGQQNKDEAIFEYMYLGASGGSTVTVTEIHQGGGRVAFVYETQHISRHGDDHQLTRLGSGCDAWRGGSEGCDSNEDGCGRRTAAFARALRRHLHTCTHTSAHVVYQDESLDAVSGR